MVHVSYVCVHVSAINNYNYYIRCAGYQNKSQRHGQYYMNIFAGKNVYGEGAWQVTDRRSFEAEEISQVKNAEVVPSDYGLSVCFFMQKGGQIYIPLSRDSKLNAGDSFDVANAEILTLHKEGSGTIERVMEK